MIFKTPLRLSLALAALLGACDPKPPPAPPAPPEPAPVAATPPAPPAAPPVLGRLELLQALDAAASVYASGQPVDETALQGRRFLVRDAFGCRGADDAETRPRGLAGWSWGRREKTIEVTLTPADWTEAPAVQPAATAEGAAPAWEAVEGFWLRRPWLRGEGCPAGAAAATAQEVVTAQSAGLAAVYLHDGSRVLRRDGKAFRHTVRGEDGVSPPQDGYRLVLEGRLAPFPAGTSVIRCSAAGPDARPVCIAAAEIDRVAFEDAAGAVLSEWRQGG